MLDSTPTLSTMTTAWRDHVSHGDIVSFRFPLAEEGSQGRPKARPCLILDIEVRDGIRYALLAYGTSSRRRSNIGYEVHVRRRADRLMSGLDAPTRFVGARRLLVPLTHKGFVICGATGSAVLGHLAGGPFAAMNAVRGRIHAEHDIAAERRSRRRRSFLLERKFTGEKRAPRRALPEQKAVQQ